LARHCPSWRRVRNDQSQDHAPKATFTGTGDGRNGTAEFWNVLEVDFATGSFSGRFTALDGTGELASLQGQGTFEGTGATGTNALRITFAP
jgi:hypothetical protein